MYASGDLPTRTGAPSLPPHSIGQKSHRISPGNCEWNAQDVNTRKHGSPGDIFGYKWSCCCLVAQLCPTLYDPMECSTPDLPVPHHFPEFAQVHVHCISDTIQPSHPLLPSSPAFKLPSIRVFSIELAVHIKWYKWSYIINSLRPRSHLGPEQIRVSGYQVSRRQSVLPQ